jgi:hypothetical protein
MPINKNPMFHFISTINHSIYVIISCVYDIFSEWIYQESDSLAKLSGHVCTCLLPSRLLWRKCRQCKRKERDESPSSVHSASTSAMGHGPSTSSSSSAMKMRNRTVNPFVNGNPNPQDESFSSIQNDEPISMHVPHQSLRSKSYLNYRRSTASLSKLFQKSKWNKRRGSISASFNINENDIKVGNENYSQEDSRY